MERGKPHQDGVYEVNIKQVAIVGHSTPVPLPGQLSEEDAPDSYLFNSTFLFKLQIAPNATALEFKQKILETYNENMRMFDASIAPLEMDQVRIRNPKLEDIGDVIPENGSLET